MRYLTYSIRSAWVKDSRSPRWIAEAFLETLKRLEPLSSAMRNWLVINGPEFDTLPPPGTAAAMEALVEQSLEWKYPDGPDHPDYGYAVLCMGAPVPRDVGKPDSVHISINAGGLVDNHIAFEIGSPQLPKDYAVITYPVYRGALETLVSVWPCPWAIAYVYDADKAPIDRAQHSEMREPFEVAWIGYLSAPLATGLAPPPDLVAERTPGGGLILSAVQTRLDPSNPDHMRRSRQLEAIMLERVGLSEYGRANEPPARVGPY
jgi:hypothetical protein